MSGTDAFIAHLEKAGWPDGRMAVAPLDLTIPCPAEMSKNIDSAVTAGIWSVSIGIHSPLSRIFKYSLSFALFRDAETSTHHKTDIIQISVSKTTVRCA